MPDLQALANGLDKLPPNDRNFARSLISQAEHHGLSPKQWEWVDKLNQKISNPPQQVSMLLPGDIQPVVTLLETAAKHLKFPKLLLRASGLDIRLSIAGPKSKNPGEINVTSVLVPDGAERRTWYGKISRDGKFTATWNLSGAQFNDVVSALLYIAQDPAKAASEYGHLTGHCCFCHLPLTDERSTAVGYGKKCAQHFELPWG